jgi:hypothetical protein
LQIYKKIAFTDGRSIWRVMTLNYLYNPDSALRFRSSKRFLESDMDMNGVTRDKVAPISQSLCELGLHGGYVKTRRDLEG